MKTIIENGIKKQIHKHHNLDYSKRYEPGYTKPKKPRSKREAHFPSHQKFQCW